MVKLAYEVPDKIEYPLVVLTEILNSEDTRYTTDKGEQVTDLTYQVECICRATNVNVEVEKVNEETGETETITEKQTLDSTRSAKLLALKVSHVLGGTYKLRRLGNNPLNPVNADKTIMRAIDRYEGCLFLKQNIIYRR